MVMIYLMGILVFVHYCLIFYGRWLILRIVCNVCVCLCMCWKIKAFVLVITCWSFFLYSHVVKSSNLFLWLWTMNLLIHRKMKMGDTILSLASHDWDDALYVSF